MRLCRWAGAGLTGGGDFASNSGLTVTEGSPAGAELGGGLETNDWLLFLV